MSYMAEFIKRNDSLNEGREKINKSIQDSEDAKNTANDADTKATQALSNSEDTQNQLDQVVIEGDSSVEAAQARVDTEGTSHQTLKERLDTEYTETHQKIDNNHDEVTSQLAQNTNSFKLLGGSGDGTTLEKNAFDEVASQRNVLYLPKGVYNFGSSNLDIGNLTKIVGDGSVILGGLRITDKKNITIEGVHFKSTNIRIGIQLTNFENVTFRNCTFENTRIYAQSPNVGFPSKRLKFEGCSFIGEYDNAPLHEYPMVLFGIEGISILNSYFENYQTDRVIKISSNSNKDNTELLEETDNISKDIKILGNTFKGVLRNAHVIDLFNSSDRIIISNNIFDIEGGTSIIGFKGWGEEGTYTKKNKELIVSHNVINCSTNNALRLWGNLSENSPPNSDGDVQRFIVQGNHILNTVGTGVYVRGCEEAIIDGNTITAVDAGVRFATNDIEPVKHGTISNNILGEKTGISIGLVEHVSIVNNQFKDIKGKRTAILLSAQNETGVSIRGNYFKSEVSEIDDGNISNPSLIRLYSGNNMKFIRVVDNVSDLPDGDVRNRTFLPSSIVDSSKVLQTLNSWDEL